jgi:hypothetical protein
LAATLQETTIKYPEGYRPVLEDGYSYGDGGDVIEKWHDWYTLANLLLMLRNLVDPVGRGPENRFNAARKNLLFFLHNLFDSSPKNRFNAARKKWDALRKHKSPTEDMTEELKSILTKLTDAGVTCVPSKCFKRVLVDN